MPSAIIIVTALFPCSALLLLFWAIGCQQIGLGKNRKALVSVPAHPHRGCMVKRKHTSNEDGILW